MAIIYSYPLADEVTNDSWVLGSEMDNGLRVVKNYSVGDIVSFTRGFVTLNDVLDNDNESLLDAKVGELYLYDDANADYGKIRLNDNIFRLIGSNGSDVLYAEGPLLIVGNMNLVGDNLTVSRFFTLPNKDGTFALTSDLVTGYVPYTGATGSINIGSNDIYTFGGAKLADDGSVYGSELYIYDSPNGGHAVLACNDNVFTLRRSDLSTMISCDDGDLFTINNGTANATIVNPLTVSRNYTLPNASGTFALTVDLPQVANNFANDAAAEIGGIDLGGLYHTNGTVKIRID